MATMTRRSLRRSTPLVDVLSDVFGAGSSQPNPAQAPSTERRCEEAIRPLKMPRKRAAPKGHTGLQHTATIAGARSTGTQLEVLSSSDAGAASAAATKVEITTTQSESTSLRSPMCAEGTQQLLADLAEVLGDSVPAAVSGDHSPMPVDLCCLTSDTLAAPSHTTHIRKVGVTTRFFGEDHSVLNAAQTDEARDEQSQKYQESQHHSSPCSRWWEMPLDHIKTVQKRRCANSSLASPTPSRKRRYSQGAGVSAAVEDMACGPVGIDDYRSTDPGDDWFERLMKRRAERNAPEPPELEKESVEGPTKTNEAKAAKKAARLAAIEAVQAQLSENARVRAAAEKAGWQAGFADEPRVLETPPPVATSAISCGTTKPARVRRGNCAKSDRGAAAVRSEHPPVERTTVLPSIQIPVDVACAAKASDIFHDEQRALLIEASRACRQSRSEAPEVQEEALAVLQHLQQRSKEEPSRRALMRSCGVCPKAAVFEKASIGRSSEGKLSAQTIANEFEAKTFVQSAQLGDSIEVKRPGYLCEWHPIDEGHVELLSRQVGPKDFAACAESAAKLGATAAGVFVGRLALAGMTRKFPFLIKSGFSHFVCGSCDQWVSKQNARHHNMRCVGDACGRARSFRQPCGEGLGLTLSFRHFPKLGVVELQAEAAVEAAIRRACWACYWAPDELRCAWRLTRHQCAESNVFPSYDGGGLAGCGESGGSDDDAVDCAPRSQNIIEAAEDGVAHQANSAATTKSSEERPAQTGPHFVLHSSYQTPQASQPLSFVRPLTSAQLHTLGWMRKREDCEDAYLSTQVLREQLAETDVCLEVRLERTFRTARGGILADALGYGKTACMIGLVTETRQQPLQELLSLGQWPQIAGQRVLTNATLIVTPPNLFEQWIREIRKFVVSTSGLRILAVPSHTKLKTLTVADFVAADIVLVSFRFFFSEAYQRYFDELTKPGLKVWDDASVQRREAFNKKQRAGEGKRVCRDKSREQPQKFTASLGLGLRAIKREREPDVETAQSSAVKTEPAVDTATAAVESMAVDGLDAEVADEGGNQSAAPALQLSKYYLEMRAGKHYLPQRYLDLERRTRRLLREAETAEELAQSPALFEMFYFKRVVFDEFHEVVQVSSQQATAASSTARAPFYALHALQGRSHWGLTATPFLSSAAAVAHMASLLRVFVPHHDEEEAQRFLDTWITSNTWDSSGIPLKEHLVEVELTVVERALYLHQHNMVLEQGSCGTDNSHARAAERRLLQLCTYFDPDNGTSQIADNAHAALRQQLQRLRGLLDQATSRQRLCEAQREDLLGRWDVRDRLQAALPDHIREANLACAHCELSELQGLAEAALHASDARLSSELALVEADLRRLAQAAVDGQLPAVTPHLGEGCEPCRHLRLCEERVKHFNRSKGQSLGDQRQAETQMRFLEVVFGSLEASTAEHMECPACLHDASPSTATILPCGHRLHLACANAAIGANGSCPQCQRPAALHTCTHVAELLHHAALTANEELVVTGRNTIESLRSQYGSKIMKVIETIQDIQNNEGEATKCLVFIQWDSISLQLESALKAVGITPLVLRGHLSQRQRAIAKFVDGRGADSSVLLLSLEHSPSGMNLACAHHVLLVHPMHADRCEEAAAYEMQAIGRVRRRGQSHAVHIHRFVARGTVEEALACQHRELCQPRPSGAAAA